MIPKLFLDTNVVLDLLGERVTFYTSAAKIATLADKEKIRLVTSALTFATVNYILSKYEGQQKAKEKLRKFKVLTRICSLDETIIEKGLNSNFSDYEDALQYFSALKSECDMLITRNGKDFKLSEIPVFTPDEFLRSYMQ